jgi:hypothetical protein
VTDWAELRHAYGRADDLPELLAALSEDPLDGVWTELRLRLCPMSGSGIFSAAYPALVAIAGRTASWTAAARVQPLALLGAIIHAAAADEAGFRKPLADLGLRLSALQSMTHEALATTGLEGEDILLLLQASLAFEGERLWSGRLDALLDGEIDGRCPSCQSHLFLVVGGTPGFVSASDWCAGQSVPRVPIASAQADSLGRVGARIHQRLVEGGADELARTALAAFGSASCPSCSHDFVLADALGGGP